MQLRDYQIKIKDFILNTLRCNIFVKCGMGKTFSTLAALSELKNFDKMSFPILIVAPKKVAQNEWAEQAIQANITNLSFSKVLGTPEQRRQALKLKTDVYLINYELLSWLDSYYGINFPYKTIICDESTKIKAHKITLRGNKGTKHASALVKHCERVKRWINLSGTPITNHLDDIWGQQFPIDFGKALGTNYNQFLEQYFDITKKNHIIVAKTPKKNATQMIIKAIKNNTILIQNALRKPVVTDVEIVLPKDLLKQYKVLESEQAISIGDEDIEDYCGMKARQFASGTILNEYSEKIPIHNVKLKVLDKLIKYLNRIEKRNVIISYYFKHDAEALQKHYPEAVNLSTGGDKAIKDWNLGKIPILLLHPQSAGHGLNLQYGGNTMIIYSADWNSELWIQAVERIGQARQQAAGFDRDTEVYRLIVKDTVDVKITKRVEQNILKSLKAESYLQ